MIIPFIAMIPFIHSIIALVTHAHMPRCEAVHNPRLVYELVVVAWLLIVLTGAYFRVDHRLISALLAMFFLWFVYTKQYKIMSRGVKTFVIRLSEYKTVFSCFVLIAAPHINNAFRLFV